eukprot:Gb_28782 [translate_table: standard]
MLQNPFCFYHRQATQSLTYSAKGYASTQAISAYLSAMIFVIVEKLQRNLFNALRHRVKVIIQTFIYVLSKLLWQLTMLERSIITENSLQQYCTKMVNTQEWLKDVKESLEVVVSTDLESVCIYTVPNTLLNRYSESYIPRVVSLGPYHFGKQELAHIERLKSEAACQIQRTLQPNYSFVSIVEMIQSNEQKIRNCYDRKIAWDEEVFGWMMARDASFVFQSLCNFHKTMRGEQLIEPLDIERQDPVLKDVVKDIVKLENQIPLFVVRRLFKMLNRPPDSHQFTFDEMMLFACAYLCPILYKDNTIPRLSRPAKKGHVLECLRCYIVGDSHDISFRFQPRKTSKVPLSSYLPRFCFKCLDLIPKPIRHCSTNNGGNKTADEEGIMSDPHTLPTAAELKNAGIKFKRCSGGIREIKFDKSKSTLYLPHLLVNDISDVVMRNLIALEIYSSSVKKKEKGITRYAHMMNELVDTSKDVGVLRKAGIITCRLGSDEQVAQLLNSLTESTWRSYFGPIDKASKDVKEYYGNKWNILWAQFREANCSKPWLLASGVAATILLLLTVTQVVCLFVTCSKH